MQFSVALCTYNGAAYLPEQLASIAAQDPLPDELVVCDDGSGDETLSILERFAARAPLPVCVRRNERRLGSRENFARAIGRCRGQWIVLCDQDDVWLPQKMERLRERIASQPELGLVFSDALIVDDRCRPLGYTLWEAIRFTRGQQRQLNDGQGIDVLLRHNVASGATMAFRAADRELLLPIPAGWVHDSWIALILAAVAPCATVAEPLVQYRQHAGQQIGQRKRSLYEEYLRVRGAGQGSYQLVADNYAAARERLAQFPGRLCSANTLAAVAAKAEHFRAKALMHGGTARRWPLIARELLRRHYRRYSSGWRWLAQDIFL